MNSHSRPALIIITPGFPENESDSSCLPWMQNLLRKLKKQNPLLPLIIVSLQYPSPARNYRWEGYQVLALGGANKGGWLKYRLRYRVQRILQQIVQTSPVAGVLSFWYGEAARAAERFAQQHHLPHYCWIAGQDAKADNPWPRRLQIPGIRLIAVSDFIRDHFKQSHGILPGQVIPFGTDESCYSHNNLEKEIDILAAGSLIPLKNYIRLPEMVNAIRKKIPQVKALLVGSGPEEKKIREQIRELQLDNHLQLTGELPYRELLQLMQKTKVFLHPSSYEGFACVCTEALYAGAWVVRTTQPMDKPMQNCFIVKDEAAMQEQAIRLLTDYQLPEAVNEFPASDTAKKLVSLFGFRETGDLPDMPGDGPGRDMQLKMTDTGSGALW